MKSLILSIVVLLLISCGNQKIRFSRVQTNKQTVIKVDKETRTSLKSPYKSPVLQAEVIEEKKTEESLSQSIDEAKPIDSKTQNLPASESISDEVIDEKKIVSDDEKVTKALEAEKNAKRAAGLLIGSLVGFFLLLVPGIVLFIIGTVYYRRAKRAQFISQKGQDALNVARVF